MRTSDVGISSLPLVGADQRDHAIRLAQAFDDHLAADHRNHDIAGERVFLRLDEGDIAILQTPLMLSPRTRTV